MEEIAQGGPKILLADDDPGILALVRDWLVEDGYRIYCAGDGLDALRLFFNHHPDLCVVDLRMRGMDGFHLIGRIREVADTPILVLSALSQDEHVVEGLDLGADEYLVKPVSRASFLARVRSLLRRAQTTPKEERQIFSDQAVTIDFKTHEVTAYERKVELRPLEFRLLSYLVKNRNRLVTQEEALNGVWGMGEGSLDSLKWYVSSLRKKIEQDPQEPRLILNMRGQGYRFVSDQ